MGAKKPYGGFSGPKFLVKKVGISCGVFLSTNLEMTLQIPMFFYLFMNLM
jgi:hypothetical protein